MALREKIERHVEGVKVPVRTAVRTLVGEQDSEVPTTTSNLAEVIRSVGDLLGGEGSPFQQIAESWARRLSRPGRRVGCVAGKPPEP